MCAVARPMWCELGEERERPCGRAHWTAPEEAGEAWLAVVLRDERGGVGFAGFRVDVVTP